MSLRDCPHPGAGHGRFSIVTKPCPGCGCQWELRGCLVAGRRSAVTVLRDGSLFRHRCGCGEELACLLPAFVDHLDLRVIEPPRGVEPPSDATRPAA